MRNFLVFAVIAAASACAARSTQPTLPTSYACGEQQLERIGDTIKVGPREREAEAARRGWHDDEGDHFVTWPISPTDVEAIEYVVPADRRADAVQRFYDASKGTSTADWRLLRREVCTAQGGYNDALARWMKGATLDDVASELSLTNRDEARTMVHSALMHLQKKYAKEW
jgi:hypothetical protein